MFASKQELSSALRLSFWRSFVFGFLAGMAWLFGWVILAVVLAMNDYIQVPKATGRSGKPDVVAEVVEHPVFFVLSLLVVISTFGLIFWIKRLVLHRWGVACPQCDYRPDHKAMQQVSQTGCCLKCSCELVSSSAGGPTRGPTTTTINAIVVDPTDPSPHKGAGGVPIRGTDLGWVIVPGLLVVALLAFLTWVLAETGEGVMALALGLFVFLFLAGGLLALRKVWHPLPWRLLGAVAFLAAVAYFASGSYSELRGRDEQRGAIAIALLGVVGGYFAVTGRCPHPRGWERPRPPEEKDKK